MGSLRHGGCSLVVEKNFGRPTNFGRGGLWSESEHFGRGSPRNILVADQKAGGPKRKMEKVAPVAPEGGGNTNPPPKRLRLDVDSESGQKIERREGRANGAKRWLFTWNNYPENWMALLAPAFGVGSLWNIGKEVGAKGTPHLQGYVEFPEKIRPMRYKGIPKEIHWGDKFGKPCKGSREDNVLYTSKDGNLAYSNMPEPKRPLPEVELYGWQLPLRDYLLEVPDQRTIRWVWSQEGKRGKSNFIRYMVQNHGALVVGGKAADMKYQIAQFVAQNPERWPDIILVNLTRTVEHVSWAGLEDIKDGIFASSKYESGMVNIPHPHIVIFANKVIMFEEKMSRDRWHVHNIDREEIKECLMLDNHVRLA